MRPPKRLECRFGRTPTPLYRDVFSIVRRRLPLLLSDDVTKVEPAGFVKTPMFSGLPGAWNGWNFSMGKHNCRDNFKPLFIRGIAHRAIRLGAARLWKFRLVKRSDQPPAALL